MSAACPDRAIGVLDACVLIPPSLRDVLLSCANESAFRPIWQDEILDEVLRNSVRLLRDRAGLTDDEATAAAPRLIGQMRRTFPAACRPGDEWIPLVPGLTCDEKDRHVLAVAIGVKATHLVTSNARDFRPRSVPSGLAVVPPDRFLLDLLTAVPERVVDAMERMSSRFRQPKKTAIELAEQMAKGRYIPGFGDELGRILTDGRP
ncbi:PIN domain-containing protein [Kribbella sp. NPDC051718]|uniref:PIN domain-containing protein n=1 Tax=Kribbella sp. NPDC051718 TaxID=3155168 RepID=UPI0034392A25